MQAHWANQDHLKKQEYKEDICFGLTLSCDLKAGNNRFERPKTHEDESEQKNRVPITANTRARPKTQGTANIYCAPSSKLERQRPKIILAHGVVVWTLCGPLGCVIPYNKFNYPSHSMRPINANSVTRYSNNHWEFLWLLVLFASPCRIWSITSLFFFLKLQYRCRCSH